MVRRISAFVVYFWKHFDGQKATNRSNQKVHKQIGVIKKIHPPLNPIFTFPINRRPIKKIGAITMTNKKAAIFHYPSAEAALRTSRTSDRQPQRRTSQWTVNTLQTKQTAMTGASVGTMRTNMTMRCRAFWQKKNVAFSGKRWIFFFFGGGEGVLLGKD